MISPTRELAMQIFDTLRKAQRPALCDTLPAVGCLCDVLGLGV